MTTPSNMAVPFTATKVSYGQLKNNVYRVVLDVEPEDMPTEFLRASNGSVWMMGACRLDEDGKPVLPEQPEDKVKKPEFSDRPRSNQAAIMCTWTDFQEFLSEKRKVPCVDEDTAARILYKWFGINSRTELKEPRFEESWNTVTGLFNQWKTDKQYGDFIR